MSKIIVRSPFETFDFKRLARAYKELKWTWWTDRHIPKAEELRQTAFSLLKQGKQHDKWPVSSGGLKAFENGDIGWEEYGGYKHCLKAWEIAAHKDGRLG